MPPPGWGVGGVTLVPFGAPSGVGIPAPPPPPVWDSGADFPGIRNFIPYSPVGAAAPGAAEMRPPVLMPSGVMPHVGATSAGVDGLSRLASLMLDENPGHATNFGDPPVALSSFRDAAFNAVTRHHITFKSAAAPETRRAIVATILGPGAASSANSANTGTLRVSAEPSASAKAVAAGTLGPVYPTQKKIKVANIPACTPDELDDLHACLMEFFEKCGEISGIELDVDASEIPPVIDIGEGAENNARIEFERCDAAAAALLRACVDMFCFNGQKVKSRAGQSGADPGRLENLIGDDNKSEEEFESEPSDDEFHTTPNNNRTIVTSAPVSKIEDIGKIASHGGIDAAADALLHARRFAFGSDTLIVSGYAGAASFGACPYREIADAEGGGRADVLLPERDARGMGPALAAPLSVKRFAPPYTDKIIGLPTKKKIQRRL
ncbi:hypothetical protein BDK51DRAFT_51795 [Blyttiomyces helicus]|uniref:Uncharacterized protein n=1 Tax=Blyttiomyces helicus TaxID=388810 RepID=A0A4V1IPE4_9FUNG|nr:hypothetical protein BDK51DRAFT_51795 [Blyttiomyces helicus]|eukprot:RKO82767.1 hypothetical protein BDK51DRAFT_51795 [Blyttiomyces helicus]